jgi:hypothetical protein
MVTAWSDSVPVGRWTKKVVTPTVTAKQTPVKAKISHTAKRCPRVVVTETECGWNPLVKIVRLNGTLRAN